MKSKKRNTIARRAASYAEMGELPDELQRQLPTRYVDDVQYLLDEIDRLSDEQRIFARIICGQDETIDNLKADKQAMAGRLRQVIEKYDWHKEVFSPPRVVTQPSTRTRVTDNRQL